jgi:predicted secreted hydrolase
MTYLNLMSKYGLILFALGCLMACGNGSDSANRLAAPTAEQSLQSLLGEEGDMDGFERATTVRALRFPADHGPHPQYRSEWWYVTGSLQDDQGQFYGVQFTAFRQAIAPPDPAPHGNPWRTPQVYMAHLALSDTTTSRHLEDQRMVRAHPQLGGARAQPFAVWVDGWTLASSGAAFLPLQLKAESTSFGIDLVMSEGKPIVLQGDQGLSRKGPEQASYYYSMTRLRTTGRLRLGERTVDVQGHTWLDREWSTGVLSHGQIGWDWFALQLDQGDDMMVVQLRRQDHTRDSYDNGVRVDPDGTYRVLQAEDFTLTPLNHWRDERGVRWPIRWRLTLAKPQQTLVIQAAFPNQRMDTAIVYWEGLVYVLDADERAIGRGYMELTGYH